MASVTEIHAYLVKANAIGNRARLRFAVLLLRVAEGRLFYELGHPDVVHYAEHCFKMGRTETHEALRVAKLIPERPELREAFERGEITWSLLKTITRVATSETEGEWLDFARKHTVTELKVEVQDAQEKRRDRPRADRFGLPNLTTRWGVDLTREERALLEAALEHAAGDIAASLGRGPKGGEPMGEAPPSVRDVLLYMAERFLHTDEAGMPEGRVERSDAPAALVFHQCEECRRSRLLTADGPVEVDPESVDRRRGSAREERLEPDARFEVLAEGEIDRPNPPKLARQVKLRDGDRCANPACGCREKLHAHHIVFREHGGRTIAENEVTVCTTCHALIHSGLLEVEGTPWEGLRWKPRSGALSLDTSSEERALDEVPNVTVESACADSSVNHDMSASPPAVDVRTQRLRRGRPPATSPCRIARRHDAGTRIVGCFPGFPVAGRLRIPFPG